MYNIGMRKTKQINFMLSENEKIILEKMAIVHKRTVSDYIRWLFITDYEAKYRLTDAGRQALEPEPQE